MSWAQLTGNRLIDLPAQHVEDEVPYWQWNGQPINPAFLAHPTNPVRRLSGRGYARRVQVLLPYDYERSDKAYPVLYLNDGQNLIGARGRASAPGSLNSGWHSWLAAADMA